MKVYERINHLKGTDATVEQMANWGLENKVCPVDMDEGLEIEDCDAYPKQLRDIATAVCAAHGCDGCDLTCLTEFLDAEYSGVKMNG